MSSAGPSKGTKLNLVSSELELIDPNPDIFALFVYFNDLFFQGGLGGVTVEWSPRMTLCAGICRFKGPIGGCSVHLSKPLLSLRPRRDLIETLLHEMIHAYLFVTDKNREREDHGPKFLSHMHRINQQAGTNISVYHSFHDEVEHFRTHWWRCNGPCQQRSPYFGIVKRSMNRAPGKNDTWWADHQRTCGGSYTKIKEPSPKKTAASKRKKTEMENVASGSKKITNFFSTENKSPEPKPKVETSVGSSTTPPAKTSVFTGGRQKLGSNLPAINTSAFTGNGHKLGGSSSTVTQPPQKKIRHDTRPPEHPLLALWNSKKTIETKKPILCESEQKKVPDRAKTGKPTNSMVSKPKRKLPAISTATDIDVIVIDSD